MKNKSYYEEIVDHLTIVLSIADIIMIVLISIFSDNRIVTIPINILILAIGASGINLFKKYGEFWKIPVFIINPILIFLLILNGNSDTPGWLMAFTLLTASALLIQNTWTKLSMVVIMTAISFTGYYLIGDSVRHACSLAAAVFIGGLLLERTFNFLSIQQQKISAQKNEIEIKQNEIEESIQYAKRIQSAILKPLKYVENCLPNSFILYKPKDIVAGDFYWIEKREDKIYFAACDCTGHGVPGAMVSVLCNNALNRSVSEYAVTKPGEILDKTKQLILQEFEKSEVDVKDGMDIALCSLELVVPDSMVLSSSGSENISSEELRTLHSKSETREPQTAAKLQYAGAHNPLWIIRNGEILEYKGDKQPVGKFESDIPFTTHEIELQKNDSIYLFSDGYPDQFGGENLPTGKAGGKKYKTGKLKKFLLSINNLPMDQQKNLLDQEFESWRGNLEQIDDVCVIGVKI